MKTRVEEVQNNKRQRRQSPPSVKPTPSLPLDLISQIFLKLPANAVAKFRCVSKLWSTVTTDPYFINKFETQPRLLLYFKGGGDKLFVFSVSQHNPNDSYSHYSSSQPINSYHMKYPKRISFISKQKTKSVHGLICFQKSAKPIVWNPNPNVRKLLYLPRPDKSWKKGIIAFLGYDPIDCVHKVVCMPSGEEASDECRVLTLGSSNQKYSWRRIRSSCSHRPFVYGQCINGVLYYQAQLGGGSGRAIMSFDVRSEKFSVIALPWAGYWEMRIITYERKFACVGSVENSISMWVLEDAEKLKWSNHIFLPLSHYYDQGLENFKLMGTTDEGELIYVQTKLFKSFHVIYIHPRRKTFRKVDYRGIVDDEFRKRHRLGEGRLRGLQVFPNHVETLLSY